MVAGGLPWPVYLYDAGRLLALTGFVRLTFQYVLSSRIQGIEKGIGLDNLLVNHRGCGVFIVLLITVHPLLLLQSEKLQKELILFWANKMEKDIAFRNELDKMVAEMPSLRAIHILSRQENWPGEKGHIHMERFAL